MKRRYSDEFMARVLDLAVLGLTPIQIAERLKLSGDMRRDFLFDINSKGHPLFIAYRESVSNGEEDIEAAIQNMAAGGDTDAQELWAKINRQRRIDDIKKELFDI